LPAILISEDQSEVQVGVSAQFVIWPVVEDPGEAVALPVEIAAQGAGPDIRKRHGVLRPQRYREVRSIWKLIAADVFVETLTIVRCSRVIEPVVAGIAGRIGLVRRKRDRIDIGIRNPRTRRVCRCTTVGRLMPMSIRSRLRLTSPILPAIPATTGSIT